MFVFAFEQAQKHIFSKVKKDNILIIFMASMLSNEITLFYNKAVANFILPENEDVGFADVCTTGERIATQRSSTGATVACIKKYLLLYWF
jgi:hypothetical protein